MPPSSGPPSALPAQRSRPATALPGHCSLRARDSVFDWNHEAPPRENLACRRDVTGAVVHAGAPECHGDPLGGGVLCFHHFGWALLDDLRAAGFADAVAQRIRDPALGLPHPHWVLRAVR